MLKDKRSHGYKHDSYQFFVRCRQDEECAFNVKWESHNEPAFLRPGTINDIRKYLEVNDAGVVKFIDVYIEDNDAPNPEFTHTFERLITSEIKVSSYVPARLTFLAI